MKLLGAACLFILASIGSVPVSAAQVTESEKIVVHAYVLPSRYVIINDKNIILEIGGNTAENITPKVFLNNLNVSSERPLTSNLLDQYSQITASVSGHPGIIYKFQTPPPTFHNYPLGLRLNISGK